MPLLGNIELVSVSNSRYRMMLSKLAATLFLLAAALPVAYGHGVITEVVGANGMTALGFGVDPATPRDGTKRNPFQVRAPIHLPCRFQHAHACH